jgi:hypothetical protein
MAHHVQPANGSHAANDNVVRVQTVGTDGTTAGGISLQPATSGGSLIYRNIDLDETGILVVAGAHQVYGYYLFNAAASVRYIKFYNKATAPTVGTDTPVMTYPLPAGAAANVAFPNGVAFSLGIGVGATTGLADNSTGAPADQRCGGQRELQVVATFVNDTFTGAINTALTAHTGETGATWTKHASSGAGTVILTDVNRARVGTTGGTILYYASGTPAGADYSVAAPVFAASNTTRAIGVTGRVDTAANTYYGAFYDGTNTRWELRSVVAGVVTTLGTSAQALTVSSTYTATLQMVGTAITLLVDGSSVVSVTDSSIAAAGSVGVLGSTASTNTTGYHLDSLTATDAVAATTTRSLALTGVGS